MNKTLQLLYVDDDENELFFFRRAVRLASVPIAIEAAEDGEQALERLQLGETMPDIVLLDIRMPRMSGFEVLEEVRRRGRTRELPVIMFSTSSHDMDIRRAKELGATTYCVKPGGVEDLTRFVQRLYDVWTRGEVPSAWPWM